MKATLPKLDRGKYDVGMVLDQQGALLIVEPFQAAAPGLGLC
jgi:hypothetical protein